MRVIVVHNRYSSRVPSGENLAVDDEVLWLRDAGVDVVRYEVRNDDIVSPGPLARARDGVEAVWSLSARRRFAAVLDAQRPDVVHVHNLFPLLTGSVPAVARRRGIPVVWTVHNRRLRCVAGGNFRAGAPCHECRAGWRVPGVVHRCYAGSASASALVAAASSAYGAGARRRGTTAIAISHDMASWLTTTGGFAPGSVRVKHNGVAAASALPGPAADHRRFLFVGRLAGYKGVGLLLDAWRRADVDAELHLIGDGDLADDVRSAAADDPRVTLLGHLAPEEVGAHMARARAVLVPSLWNEPFGRVAAEAFACARPVITTGRGGLTEIVDDTTGWVTGTSTDALASAIAECAASDDAVARRGERALRRHAERFSPEATTEALRRIYAEVCADRERPVPRQ